MERSARADREQERPTFYLIQLNVYLINPSTSPSLINPDFLRYNEIVDPSWQLERPVLVEPESSQIRYTNGLSLSAYDSHVVITQNAVTDPQRSTITPLTSNNVLCIGIAERYLNLVPADQPYETVSIDPIGWIEVPEQTVAMLSSPLQEVAKGIQYEGKVPEVQARAIYEFEDKRIVLYASEIPSQGPDNTLRLRFTGEILRNLEAAAPENQVSSIATVLDNWEQDINDFEDLANKFYSLYIRREK